MSVTKTTEAAPRYRVTAPLINIKTGALAGIIPGRGGYVSVSLYRGALVPEDAPAAQVQHLLGLGFIEPVAD
jgi:hypothetical protein